jgi:hypothetical protein
MKIKISFLLGLSLLLIASSAHGQSQTWVSAVGDDVNPCTRTAPCRTFAFTISVTPVGGEISVLDPGDFRAVPPVSLVDFGPVTIKKSITINGNSIAEIIPGNGENGVTISVTTPGDPGIVILRGLTINGARNHAAAPATETGGWNGIRFLAGGKLVIDHCSIYGFTQSGVQAEQGIISVANSLLTDNGVAVRAVTPGRVRLSNNDIFDNTMGLQGCGRIASAGNNKRAGSPGCSPSATPIIVE